MMKKY